MSNGKADQVVLRASERQNLAGTGSTANGTALVPYVWYELRAGSTPIRFVEGATAPTALTSHPYLPAGGSISFECTPESLYVAVIHADGSTAHEATIHPVSP